MKTRVLLFAALACAVLTAGLPAQSSVRSWVVANRSALLRELIALLEIPNVASDKENIRRNAGHLRQMLARRGFASEVLETTHAVEIIAAVIGSWIRRCHPSI